MNILMVTSETVPFSKSGGLADVVGALSESIVKLQHNVKVFMPMYSFIDNKGFKKTVEFSVPMLGGEEKVYTLEKTIAGVTYVGLVHPFFFERKGIYGDTSFAPYPDNCPRFLFFAKAACLYLKASSFNADIVHCHDWTAGTVPLYLKKFGIKAKTLFTIHNLAYQGEFSSYDAVLSGDEFDSSILFGNGEGKRINMLKCGIASSDIITTVSPTYAKEIQTQEAGCGLDWLLKEREKDLYGIINGIDYNEWNPSKDKFFKEHFSPSSLKGKAKLKERLQRENNLEINPDVPLFAMISRLAEQKGFSELLLDGGHSALERIAMEGKCQFLIIGTGDQRYVDALRSISTSYPNIRVKILFANDKAHEIEGGADFFLMPSRYEPCGLNQLYSLHYGTLPVAHRTGGLADSIIDLDEDKENGTGFLFDRMNPDEIYKSINRAIGFFSNKDEFVKAQKRAMAQDFTWTHSASEYEELYKKLAKKNVGGKNK